MNADIQAALDAAKTQATQTETVVQSAVVVIQGMAAQIAALAAAAPAGTDPVLLQAITDLATQSHNSAGELAAAIAANTTPPTPAVG